MTAFDIDSTVPHSDVGLPAKRYDASRLNAVRHGILSRFSILPWEDEDEYEGLLAAMTEEHMPAGPTETHLVVELAGVLWRKRRVRLAEIATYQSGLRSTTDTYSKTAQSALVTSATRPAKVDVADAIKAGVIDAESELTEVEFNRQMTLTAIGMLGNDEKAYQDALAALNQETREAWAEQLTWTSEDYGTREIPYTPDGASLRRYLENEILPWYANRRAEIIAQPLVRAQALGESLDPDKLERLGRYEVHLDRKFERTLSTLLRLQELRRAKVPAERA